MSFPKRSDIELPLLKTLPELGGKAEPRAGALPKLWCQLAGNTLQFSSDAL